MANVKGQINALSDLDSGITQLGNSEITYTFNTTSEDLAVLSSAENGEVVINNFGSLGNRAHETTHAIQYDNGQIKFVEFGGSKMNIPNSAAKEIRDKCLQS